MYSFEVIDIDKVNVEEYYGFEKKVLFTTKEWLAFISINQKAKPVIIRITKDSNFVGYFTGLLFSKFGIKIFGSPFEGWSTGYMGFDVVDGVSKVDLIEPLSKFLFKTFKCLYIEIADRFIEEKALENKKHHYIMSKSVEINIDKTEEKIFTSFKNVCRTSIRQFERRGASIEIAKSDEEFATEYYEQLQEVFAKQNLVPTYHVSKVINLFSSLDKEQLLCLRVRNPEGKAIATAILVGFNERFYFWGAASFREFQSYRPNEYMIWYAIKYFREKGYKYFDMCGERDYKNKFNPDKISYPCIMISRFKILLSLKDFAKKVYWFLLKLRGFGKKRKVPNTKIFKQEKE